MAKRLVLAVAGAGKTRSILDSVSEDRRSLIVTFTNANLRSLEESLIDKFGCVPQSVTLLSYFSFLYSFCFRPFFSYELRDNAYIWEMPPFRQRGAGKQSITHYMTSGRYIYGSRAAKFISEFGAVPKVVDRLNKYFDDFFVDEVQDFASNDFNLLLALSQADINMMFVGDFHQHTFDTSRDGTTRQNLHKSGLESYIREFSSSGFEIDTTSLRETYRCSPTVCQFVSEQLGISIESHRSDVTEIRFVEDAGEAQKVFDDDSIVKLFYQSQDKYNCYSNNWGKSKGLNCYQDVCIVLNQTTAKLMKKNRLGDLAESTRNKLYVACSRARGDLIFVDDKLLKHEKSTK